jgi:hypothetical protein
MLCSEDSALRLNGLLGAPGIDTMKRAFVVLFVLFVAADLQAASPSLGSIQPRGAQRGTEAIVTFNGVRLADAAELLIYYPGITVKKLEVVNDATVKATLAIAPDCRLGEHAFRVRTASGISDLRTFWIGALPVVDEKEPNSEFDKPQPIAMNVTVHGVVDSEDQDYFVIEAKKGQRISVEVEAMRLGLTVFDPYVAILNDKRFELATNDDSPLIGQDSGCSILAPADGKYIVQIRESAYGGNGACQYRLHVGNFPRPTAVVPAGGKPNEELEVTFLGDPAGPIKQKAKVPADMSDPYWRLHCQSPEGISPSGFKFRVVDVPNAFETPNNTTAAAVASPAGAAPIAFNGVIAKPDETDFFKFTAKKGQVFDVHCYARRIGSPLDPVMYFGNAAGGAITGNDDAIGPDSYFRITIPEDGIYTIWVLDHLKKGGPDYFYRIELTPPQASVSTTLPKVDGNNPSNQDRQTIAVPKGNRYAALLVGNRAEFGGPLSMSLGQLPPGLTLTGEVMDPGLNVVPFVFEAKADAPIGGVLTTINATPADPNVKAKCTTIFDASFALGQPGQTVYSRHVVEKAAVAVTEACPFSIDVIEPKVPVVQNGSYNLRIVAKRAAGFKGAITVFPLWTPPGMGIASAATIAPEATETTLAMNAAPGAAPRKWKTAVTAVSDAGKGPVWVSSQLFTIEIAPPPVTLAMERPAVEQGQTAQLFCKVAVAAPFEGKAKVTILGLPAKVTAPVLELTKDTKELAFPIVADKTSPAGKHGGIFAQIVLEKNGELITMAAGGTELRIDVPLPPKVAVATPAPMAQPTPMPQPNPAAPPKRLTRLEQLRLEQEEREKAAKGGTPMPPPPPPKK